MADKFVRRVRDVRIGPEYSLVELLGFGTYGKVYLGENITLGIKVAIKLENRLIFPSSLDEEARVYGKLVGQKGFPQTFWHGNKHDFRCLVMELLGPNLEELLRYCGGVFSLKTTLMLADQLLLRFGVLHSAGYVHRDVKPENFLLGTGKNGNIVYMTDLGLVTEDFDGSASETDSSQEPELVGTCTYASIQGHMGIDLSQKDDLEALGYMLIYFLKGELPWEKIRCRDKEVRYRKVLQMKQETSIEDLCKGLPAAFKTYMKYVRDLPVAAKPRHKYLRDLFTELFRQEKFERDQIFDWTEIEFMRLQSLQQSKSRKRGSAVAVKPKLTGDTPEEK